MKVEFLAALQGSGCLKFDGDGEGIVRFTVPASELPNLAKLLAYRETTLKVTVQAQS